MPEPVMEAANGAGSAGARFIKRGTALGDGLLLAVVQGTQGAAMAIREGQMQLPTAGNAESALQLSSWSLTMLWVLKRSPGAAGSIEEPKDLQQRQP